MTISPEKHSSTTRMSRVEAVEKGEEDEDDLEIRKIVEMKRIKQTDKLAQEHLDPKMVALMFRFLKKDPDRHQSHDSLIEFKGMNRGLTIHQVYGAFYILYTEQNGVDGHPAIGCTIWGNSPGYGKSASMAGVVHLSVLFDQAHE